MAPRSSTCLGRLVGAMKDGHPTESGAPPPFLLSEPSSGVTQLLVLILSSPWPRQCWVSTATISHFTSKLGLRVSTCLHMVTVRKSDFTALVVDQPLPCLSFGLAPGRSVMI